MKLERRVYTAHDQKVGDFMLGVGLFVIGNIIVWILFGALTALLISAFPVPAGLNPSITAVLPLALYFIPFALNIIAVVYFGFTRYWIALGMLAAFALALLVVLILGAACFALIAGLSGSSN